VRIRHLWYHRLRGREKSRVARRESRVLSGRRCDPAATLAKLSGRPQPALGWFSRAIACLTTPFKFLGISGWVDTGCSGEGIGRLVRDAQHSSDGFWTVDIALDGLSIGALEAPDERYLRLECEPATAAHGVCADRLPLAGETLRFGGPLVVDTDGPFLEVHPSEDFEVIGRTDGRVASRESRVARRTAVADDSVMARERPVRHSSKSGGGSDHGNLPATGRRGSALFAAS